MHKTFVVCVVLAGLSGGCAMGPRAPNVSTFPGKSQSWPDYEQAQTYCLHKAQHPASGTQEPTTGESAVTGGVIGGMVGAGAGAILGAVTGSPSTGAAIGGTSGALLGAAGGAGMGQQGQQTAQQRVDQAYRACMYAHGAQVEASPRHRRMMSR